MARVVLARFIADEFSGGVVEHEIDAGNVRDLFNELEARFPGLGKRLEQGSAVSIDGEIHQNALFSKIQPDSEVYILPPIEGG